MAVLALTVASSTASGRSAASNPQASGLLVFTHFTTQGDTWDPVEAIFSIRADGSGLRRLTEQCVDCADSPRWSPDGSKIAYYGDTGLVLMNVNGSGKRTICVDCFDWPSWSPDGRRIATTSPLEIIDSGSGRVVRRIPGMSRVPIEDFDWSPDGKQFAFDDDVPGQRISVVNSDGSGLHFVARGRDPRWSPDGKSLMFLGDNGRPYLVALGGGRPTPVRSFPPKQEVTGPAAWSADGREIAYFGLHGIHILDLSTGKDRQISLPPGICTGGYWCADLDWQK